MLATAVPLVGALLLAQPGSEAPVLQPPSSPRPALTWGAPTACLMLPPTQHVPSGAWRAQCDDDAQRCRVAPVRELDADGVETDRPLSRATPCTVSLDDETAARVMAYRMEPARVDAPPGWYRDERGRVMQFNFDLNRRVWLGGAWTPMSHDGQVMSRMRADFGIAVEVPSRGGKTLHRLRFLETELHLGVHSLDLALARYDFSIQREDPLLRVTSFLGKPRRHDLYLNMGLWMEALHLEQLKRDGQVARFLSLGAFHAAFDLWHSRDLVSYVRVRAGAGIESDLVHRFNALAPSAALEGDLTLDRDGFHHFRMSAEVETLLLAPRVEGRPRRPERLRVQAGYEVILLAINDQPLSLLVDGRGVRRDDIAGVPERWEWSASAGLRFSLWAPARRSAPIAARE
ncbi:hypothetical protein [Comamonas sp. JC664]|uniref:hypothetical protein n=1 Tax=Comamonas sp. JC664 TaxID=2801917 RepID=UPI00174B5674|nr:hypothetical protein [Comamonas sp. JC664]MBL0695772.1 hypothetical protein [Comamonas sp. JC664]GHG63399.1 hypothetical protein GCM10012319_02950 [Comamonas sp. KCTC 72670]